MKPSVSEEIMTLKNQPPNIIKTRYKELFPGVELPSNNAVLLWRKIDYRLQEIEYGGLSAETTNRINELIDQYDPINNRLIRPQKPQKAKKSNERDTRLPIPGAVIRKEYKGKVLEVKVLENGFVYEEKPYKTLSAVAKAVTGDHWNGYNFFKP